MSKTEFNHCLKVKKLPLQSSLEVKISHRHDLMVLIRPWRWENWPKKVVRGATFIRQLRVVGNLHSPEIFFNQIKRQSYYKNQPFFQLISSNSKTTYGSLPWFLTMQIYSIVGRLCSPEIFYNQTKRQSYYKSQPLFQLISSNSKTTYDSLPWFLTMQI